MKPISITSLFSLLALSLSPLSAQNQQAESREAEKSTELQQLTQEGLPQEWLQGEAVKAFESGKLYIFECWATWCGPCLQAMPHMEALHQKFKDRDDFQIVGVNVMDRVPSEKLLPFLKKRGIQVTYTMAADGKDGPVATHWLKPLGVNGIPFSVAIRDGRILWKGHPAGLEEGLIEAMLRPDYQPGDGPSTRQQRGQAIEKASRALQDKAAKGEMDQVRSGLLELVAGAEEKSEVLPAFVRIFHYLANRERGPEALSVLGWMVDAYPTDRTALLNAGNMALSTETLDGLQDIDLALKCANQALGANAGDVAALELQAAALFAKGEKEEAIKVQTEALSRTKLYRRVEALRKEVEAQQGSDQ